MSTRTLSSVLLVLGLTQCLDAAVVDVLPPQRRKPSVELAQKLSSVETILPRSESAPNPFAPEDFLAPDPDEEAARLAALKAAESNKPVSDHDLLEAISAKLEPSGTASVGGQPMLLFPGKRLRRGESFVITFDGRDFELEITDIQRTTFSLRYKGAEITRPIKLGKNQ